MRLKILMLICVLLAAGWFIATSWVISSQGAKIKELSERLGNMETVVYREVLEKKVPVNLQPSDKHQGLSI